MTGPIIGGAFDGVLVGLTLQNEEIAFCLNKFSHHFRPTVLCR